MEVKGYFVKIRAMEESLSGDFVVVASLATPDGGRGGRLLELTRALAAKMIVDKRARLATAEEEAAFRQKLHEEVAEAVARASEPQTAFLADISTVRKDLGKGKKR
jgi:DNA invertase Pin-like site-specific DNA recombinase